MRLWSYQLLPLLPRQQLLSQLRECVAIAKDIYETGKTNHTLINPIMDYPIEHFQEYCDMVIEEMDARDYKVSQQTIDKLSKYINYQCYAPFANPELRKVLFKDWHTDRYLVQCLYNLQEKYDCKGIKFDEWDRIYRKFYKYLDY